MNGAEIYLSVITGDSIATNIGGNVDGDSTGWRAGPIIIHLRLDGWTGKWKEQ